MDDTNLPVFSIPGGIFFSATLQLEWARSVLKF